jgi:type IV pilus assembly protein PilY1
MMSLTTLKSTIRTAYTAFKATASSRWLRRAMWGLVPLIGAVSFYATSQSSGPKAIELSAEPLFTTKAAAKPTLSLALSVEFPTVGAQYTPPIANDTTDNSYKQLTEYLGYYDADSCYVYVNTPAALAGYTTADLKRFDRSGAAVNHGCGGKAFSGNFMNWATSSAVDILRLGLTGGDRVVDTPELTVIQRAVLYNNKLDNRDFYNDWNFPAKQLQHALALEALPKDLIGKHTGDVWVANCLNRVHFGTTKTGTCDNPGENSNLGATLPIGSLFTSPSSATFTSDTFFYSRTGVCNTSGGVLADTRKYNDEIYCIRYPNGNYKPVGQLQRNSDRLRVSAFGYLMDDTTDRYGGVLRAPMKFVGPQSYDTNGAPIAGLNPKTEWDENTGVFIVNPEEAKEGKSGVVNYLNQFGRTGTSLGTYKKFDPVTELYYEAFKYVQGLDATPQATTGITDVMKDGFPVYDNSGSAFTQPRKDPHAGGSSTGNYSCINNNVMVIGDVNTHYDKSIPGNTRTAGEFSTSASLADNKPNFADWTNVVAGFERKASVSYVDGKGVTRNTNAPNTNAANSNRYNQYDDLANYSPGNSNSMMMAGIAYWGKTHDIRGKDWTSNKSAQRLGMRVTTYVLDVNEGAANTDLTNRRNNQFYLAAKYGGFIDKTLDTGNPFLDATGKTDNSGWETFKDSNLAKNYFLTSSAKETLKSIKEIFDSVASAGNSIASGSISTSSFATAGFTYTGKFEPKDWSGDVLAYPVSAPGGSITIDTKNPKWSAAAVMNAKPDSYFKDKRNVVAGGSKGNNGSAAAFDFKWDNLDSDMKAALDKPSDTANKADGLAKDRMNYLRGDKSLEGSVFRTRTSLLGDIVNSPVVYSKEFGDNINTAAYKKFKEENKARPAALFVGANDGMFHAFNADDGAELFAYIPSWLASKLPALTDPTYNASKHQSYVDGKTDVTEALVGTAWKTVLISSTGGGGQGVFALDVSNPANFNKDKVMWEFTDRDDADLGNVLGTPKIAKMQTNQKSTKTKTTVPEYGYFAIVPSGVNNFVADGEVSKSKKPHLFILSLNKATGDKWVEGKNYYKIEIPTDDALSKTVSPGVINFDAVTGAANEIDTLYMGDLHGNLWKLDFDSASSVKTLNNLKFIDLTGDTSQKPLFVAKDNAGNVQPIVMTPKLVYGPNRSIIVMFGTGKYLEASDNNLTPVRTQSVYAIDDLVPASGQPKVIEGRAYLEKGTAKDGVVSIASFVWGRAKSAGDTTQRSGWYFDFPAAGERQLSEFVTWGTTAYFGSVIPPQNVDDPCSGGSGNIYAINFATGSGTSFASTVGLVSQLFLAETTAAIISDSDSTGRRTTTTTKRLLIKGSDGYATPLTVTLTGTPTGTLTGDSARLSWRQINNYYELREK